MGSNGTASTIARIARSPRRRASGLGPVHRTGRRPSAMMGAAKGCVKTASSAARLADTPRRDRRDSSVSATLKPTVAGTASTDEKKKETPPHDQKITEAGTAKVPIIPARAAPAASAESPPARLDAHATSHGTAASVASTPPLKKATFHPSGANSNRAQKSLLSMRLA